MASNDIFISTTDWSTYTPPPTGNYLLFESSGIVKYNGNISTAPPLKVNLDSVPEFAGVDKEHLKLMTKTLFSLYYMPDRIKFNNTDFNYKVTLVDGPSGVGQQRINLRKNSANPLVFIHELLHACIQQMGYSNYGTHAGEYVLSPCKNLLVFNEGTQGLLCDSRTILAANFKNVTFTPYAQHHELLFPTISYAYNLYFSNRCKVQNKSATQKSKETINSKNLLEDKFGMEYDFLKQKVNEKIFGEITREQYVTRNINDLEKISKKQK